MSDAGAWPAIDVASWAPTKKSLHLYAQMLGKLRLALSPHRPNFAFTALTLTPRGFSTGVVPCGARSIAVSVDVFDAAIVLEASDGASRRIALAAPQTIARVFAALHAALAELGIAVTLSPIPQEIPDTTPLDTDDRPAIFRSADAQRWLAVVTAVSGVFERWAAHFFGRTELVLWWGAFDFNLLLFDGTHVEPPADRGYLFRYDLDAGMTNLGFYPGDEKNPPNFFGYIYPQPASCDAVPIAPADAAWSAALGEWVLPYESVRTSADPEATLAAFLDAVYAAACGTGGWDRAAFTYVPPPLRRAR